jgi:hypothetical protein
MTETTASAPVAKKPTVLLIVAWAWVLVPFAYGVNQLVVKVVKLFNS